LTIDLDSTVRLRAFEFVRQLGVIHEDSIPKRELERGFEYQSDRVHIIGPQVGIFKPRQCRVPLSILTAPEVLGKERPYDDFERYDGLITYRYRGTDPNHRDNVGLRTAMRDHIPLIYFRGLNPGRYCAVLPVFIVGDDPAELAFTVDPTAAVLPEEVSVVAEAQITRDYVNRMVRQRLHQAAFRAQVISAYSVRCAICSLKNHEELLDAAHIIPDRKPEGVPEIPNGLSLCKLHHAAYDANVIGIRPDLSISVRGDVLNEVDGPMLLHGLQGLDGHQIVVPSRPEWRPRKQYLEQRYELFREAG
jgi:putative restriction endonuclease